MNSIDFPSKCIHFTPPHFIIFLPSLFYISDGDPRLDFYIGRDTGNILLAHKLDHELQREYILNISVTDTVHTVYTTLNVSVIDINDHR